MPTTIGNKQPGPQRAATRPGPLCELNASQRAHVGNRPLPTAPPRSPDRRTHLERGRALAEEAGEPDFATRHANNPGIFVQPGVAVTSEALRTSESGCALRLLHLSALPAVYPFVTSPALATVEAHVRGQWLPADSPLVQVLLELFVWGLTENTHWRGTQYVMLRRATAEAEFAAVVAAFNHVAGLQRVEFGVEDAQLAALILLEREVEDGVLRRQRSWYTSYVTQLQRSDPGARG